jgi:hypothetical protein
MIGAMQHNIGSGQLQGLYAEYLKNIKISGYVVKINQKCHFLDFYEQIRKVLS